MPGPFRGSRTVSRHNTSQGNGRRSTDKKDPNAENRKNKKPENGAGRSKAEQHDQNGKEGERIVATLFSSWEHIEGKPGHDFLVNQYDRKGKPTGKKRFVEVKATFSKEEDERKLTIVLKVYGRKWMNEVADDVVVVTRKKIYFGSAQKIREYISAHYAGFRRVPSEKHEERIAVTIGELVEGGLIGGGERKKIDHKIARSLYRLHCLPETKVEKPQLTFFQRVQEFLHLRKPQMTGINSRAHYQMRPLRVIKQPARENRKK